MKILGYEVTEQQERACLGVMGRVFKADDVKLAALNAGVPETWTAVGATRKEDLPGLVAHRLISRLLDAGVIERQGHVYVVVEQPNDQ